MFIYWKVNIVNSWHLYQQLMQFRLCNALSVNTWQNKNLKLQEFFGLDTSVTVYTSLSSTQKKTCDVLLLKPSYYWRFTRGLYSFQTQNEMLKKVGFFFHSERCCTSKLSGEEISSSIMQHPESFFCHFTEGSFSMQQGDIAGKKKKTEKANEYREKDNKKQRVL